MEGDKTISGDESVGGAEKRLEAERPRGQLVGRMDGDQVKEGDLNSKQAVVPLESRRATAGEK